MDSKGMYVIGFGIILTLVLGLVTDNVKAWATACFVISFSFIGHAYYEYKRANFHKFPLKWELFLALLTPILIPLMALYCLPRDLYSEYVSRSTVRGVFEKFHTELTTWSKYQRDNPIADLRTSEVAAFFESYPHLFEGLPGGIGRIDDYATHCSISLRLSEYRANRYYIEWSRMDEFQHAIVAYNLRNQPK